MRVILIAFLLLSVCAPAGTRAVDIQEITISSVGRNYKGDGHASSLTFRRDGTAEDKQDKIEHDQGKPERYQRATVTPEQFNQLAQAVISNHFFTNEPNTGVPTDSSEGITVLLTNKQKRYSTMYSGDTDLQAISEAMTNLSKQLQWQDIPTTGN